jgi:hypothetical protein
MRSNSKEHNRWNFGTFERWNPWARRNEMDPMIAICLCVVAAMAVGFVVMRRKKA